MQLTDMRVLVAGAGKSGVAAIRFLLSRGARVSLSETAHRISLPGEISERLEQLETGGHTTETFIHQDLIVISPGIPLEIRPVIEARARGIEVISEVELAARCLQAPIIAVTGTNGKTTTTELIGHMFRLAGREVFVGGNIGTPLAEALLQPHPPEWVVAEISSFQLDGTRLFRPHVSIILNITDDHLDRYASFAEYALAKQRIMANQTAQDFAVLNFDDRIIRQMAGQTAARTLFFSNAVPLEEGACAAAPLRIRLTGSDELIIACADLPLQGPHNRENMAAAVLAAHVCGIDHATITTALQTFVPLPHRLELVGTVNGVHFYNDSKGTNVDACLRALQAMPGPVVLIAGGRDKGGSYAPLYQPLQSRGRKLIVIGEAAERLAQELRGAVETQHARTLEEALQQAAEAGRPGDCVLLSPACSSFDMFTSYQERGERFRTLVQNLQKRE